MHQGAPGVKPEALVNQPPLHTHPALGRRLNSDDAGFGLRSSVVPEFHAVRSGDSVPFPVQQVRQIPLLGNDTRVRLALG